MTLTSEQDAIKQAVEAGGFGRDEWRTWLKERDPHTEWTGYEYSEVFGTDAFNLYVQTPAFWQALGKARGWVVFSEHQHAPAEACNGFCIQDVKASGWKSHALRYFETKLSGGDTSTYWKNLP